MARERERESEKKERQDVISCDRAAGEANILRVAADRAAAENPYFPFPVSCEEWEGGKDSDR